MGKRKGAPRMHCNGCGRFMPVSEADLRPDGQRTYTYECGPCGREQWVELPAPTAEAK